MLTSTYVHLSGIGYSTERRLWQAGAWSWEEFLRRPPEMGISPTRAAALAELITTSRDRLASGDYRFFAEALSRRDQWRAFPEFSSRVLYLDIETTGGADFDDVTVIGVHDGRQLRQFVRGEDLLEAEAVLEEATLLVTFFGTGFDIPVLRRLFPRLPFDQLHVDLCHALRRLGYRGGLKAVERQLGLARPPEIAGMGGWDAVYLWRQHQLGSSRARRLLLDYNRADVENMIPLMALVYDRLRERTLAEVELNRTE
jgi:uncharacterized protein YprB with RNaseH-like and TPR domain